MSDPSSIPSNKTLARQAGLLYLIVVLTGIFSIAYVPSQTIVANDAAATIDAIKASLILFKLGIAAGIACYVAFLLLPFALYRLLNPAGRTAAFLMVALAVVSVPIALINITYRLDVLSLLESTEVMKGLSQDQLQAQVMMSLDAYRNGVLVCSIFWGLWLLPFGYLVYKSGILPRILGVLLMIGCFGYLVDVFATLFSSGYPASAIARHIHTPGAIGEIGTCLWLLIMGSKESSTRGSQIGDPALNRR